MNHPEHSPKIDKTMIGPLLAVVAYAGPILFGLINRPGVESNQSLLLATTPEPTKTAVLAPRQSVINPKPTLLAKLVGNWQFFKSATGPLAELALKCTPADPTLPAHIDLALRSETLGQGQQELRVTELNSGRTVTAASEPGPTLSANFRGAVGSIRGEGSMVIMPTSAYRAEIYTDGRKVTVIGPFFTDCDGQPGYVNDFVRFVKQAETQSPR